MFAIGQLFNRGKNKERIGQILLTNEVLPHFHGIPPISNKTIHVVKKSVDENTVEVFRWVTPLLRQKRFYICPAGS